MSENDCYVYAIPWYAGMVRHLELRTQFAIIPLNLAMGFWFWFLDGVRWNFLPAAVKWPMRRRALKAAMERGRRAGYNQGRAAAMCDHELVRHEPR